MTISREEIEAKDLTPYDDLIATIPRHDFIALCDRALQADALERERDELQHVVYKTIAKTDEWNAQSDQNLDRLNVAIAEIDEARAQLATANDKVRKLVEALEPFANCGPCARAQAPDGLDDELTVIVTTVADTGWERSLSTGDFARAHAALSQAREEETK